MNSSTSDADPEVGMRAAALNLKQLKFVAGVLAGLTATDAYTKAGYKAKERSAGTNASRLLAHAGVRAAIEAARHQANQDIGITAAWYAARVKLEAERTGPGSSHAARVSALKIAGDLLGVAEKHKHEVTGADGAPIRAEQEHRFSLTAADLDALDQLAPPVGGA